MSQKHFKPVYWGIFSAGGTAAAMLLAPLLLVMCILLPFGLIGSAADFYRSAHDRIRQPWLYIPLAGLFFLFLWHGVHRFYYILHDMHIPASARTRWAFYGFAVAMLLLSLVTGHLLP